MMQIALQCSTLDKTLVDAVRSRPVIYDLANPSYHKPQAKEAAWNAVLQQIIDNGFNCKDVNYLVKRWKYLRDYYSKIKKDREKRAQSGTPPSMPVKWPYYSDMTFLDDRSHRQSLSENLQQLSERVTLPFIIQSSRSLAVAPNANEESVDDVVEPTAGEVVIDDVVETILPDHAYVPENAAESDSSDDDAFWKQRTHKRLRKDTEAMLECLKTTTRMIEQFDCGVQPIPSSEKTKEQIFGEFVAKMLSEMDEQTKKKHIRDITIKLTS